MGDDFQYDVLLSHSAKDKAVVRPLAERLRTERLRTERLRADAVTVWFDEWEMPKDEGGRRNDESNFHTLYVERPERSRVLVLRLLAQAFGSDWAPTAAFRRLL